MIYVPFGLRDTMPEKTKGKETTAVHLLKWTVFFRAWGASCPEFVRQRMCECYLWCRCGYIDESHHEVVLGIAPEGHQNVFGHLIRKILQLFG